MEQYFQILKTIKLFDGVDDSDLISMLRCLGAEARAVKRGEIILLAGERPRYVGGVLSGEIRVTKEEADGRQTIVTAVRPGEIFAEALCCAGILESPVTVTAETDSAVLLIRFDGVLHTCPNACAFHRKLIGNMLKLLAHKNIFLQNRMDILSLKSIREKVLRYLGSFSAGRGECVTIPFNREELANYLCVERSALSHELSRMKKDGLLTYKKNHFVLDSFLP